MSGLQNLFSVEPTLPSIQTHKMPDNPEKWAEVLTTYLKEQYPDAAQLDLAIEFRKRDNQSGTAIGAIHVTSLEAEKSLFVPFIVKKFELAPLDIWMEAKTQAVHPMTKDTFKEVFFVQSPAEGLDKRPTDSSGTYFNDPSMWNTNMPPLQGRYSYASAGYEMLDKLSDTFTKEDGEAFKQTLKDNAHLIPKFEKNGHLEIIKKLAAKSYPNTSDYAASAMSLIPVAVASIKKEDTDKYSILSSIEGLFDLSSVQTMDRYKCEQFLAKITGAPKDFMNEVDQEGEKMLIVRKPAPGVFLYDADEAGPEAANDFAMYQAKTKTGMLIKGLVIPHVVDFAGKKKNYKMFLSRTHSSFQSSIAGARLIGETDTEDMQKILKPADIRVGQTGTFVYVHDGKALATEPVTISAIEQYGPISVVDLNGKKFNVRRGYGDYFTKDLDSNLKDMAVPSYAGKAPKAPKQVRLESLGFAELSKDAFVIPDKMMWIPMEGFTDVCSSKSDWLTKQAAERMEMDPLTVRYTGIVYDISGAGLPRMELSKQATEVLLATAGMDQEKIAKVMKKAKAVGKAKAHGVDRLHSKADKASATAKMIAKISSDIASLKRNLIKEASELKDTATVDTLLSLNFLNPDNLAKFIAYKPIFDKVLDYLAQLTLASRMGLQDIPESATVTAMGKLMEVCDGLHKMQASMKRPSTKTAAAPALPLKKGKKYLPSKAGKLIATIGG